MGGNQSTPSGLNAYSTAEEASRNVNLSGKLAIVTGANCGIGKETARVLALRGASVVMACRDLERGNAALADILANLDANPPPPAIERGELEVLQCDLGSFASVREFANTFLDSGRPLHLLICNAGVMAFPERRETVDGIEAQMGINHYGHYLLIRLLQQRVVESSPARIVIVSSMRHYKGVVDFDDLQGETTYEPNRTYNMSKLCNVLTAFELSRRLEGTGVCVYALNPGFVATSLFNNNTSLKVFTTIATAFMKSIPQGAATTLYAATSLDLEGVSGVYLSDCNVKEASVAARDTDAALRLWEISERVVGLVEDNNTDDAGPAQPATTDTDTNNNNNNNTVDSSNVEISVSVGGSEGTDAGKAPAPVEDTPAAAATPPQPRKLKRADMVVKKKTDEVIMREPGYITGKPFQISFLENCDVYACDNLSQSTVDKCTRCRVFIGPCEASVFVRDCTDCVFVIAAQQFRTRDCTNCDFYLYTLTAPIIESSNDVRFACFQANYDGLADQFAAAKLDPFTNEWSAIYDFTPAEGGELNWSFIESGESAAAKLVTPSPDLVPGFSLDDASSVVPKTHGSREVESEEKVFAVVGSADAARETLANVLSDSIVLIKTKSRDLDEAVLGEIFGGKSLGDGNCMIGLLFCGEGAQAAVAASLGESGLYTANSSEAAGAVHAFCADGGDEYTGTSVTM